MITGGDIIIYHPTFNGKEFIPTTYSLRGVFASYNYTELDFIYNFIKNSFLTKEECINKCSELNKKSNKEEQIIS